MCIVQALRHIDTHDYYAVHLDPSISPSTVAEHLSLDYEGKLGELSDHYLFKTTKSHRDVVREARFELKRRRRKRELGSTWHILDAIKYSQKQELRRRLFKRTPPSRTLTSRLTEALTYWKKASPVTERVSEQKRIAEALGIGDPTFAEQWHLYNTAEVGRDLNVVDVWQSGVTGQNATVCIIDDGIDMDSEDIKINYFAKGSYDFNEHVDEPRPRLFDDHHGTRCAGEVAAVKNDVCGIGVAWDAKVSGLRILSKPITDADEAIAMNYEFEDNHIYSCSWGPPDDGQSMDAPGILIRKAMVNAVQNGRGGKGTIYVFAAGNGKAKHDNCNFDGYTNSIYSITIGAVDKEDQSPYYSEECSAQLVVTYSSGGGDGIHTTDVGKHKCTGVHGGTSAAGPLAAGVYALVLSVRPDLTWRDLQWLNVMAAAPIEVESDWQMTASGKKYSHQFGYGKLDSQAIVEAARNFTSVKPQAWFFSPVIHVNHNIPQGKDGLASTLEVTEQRLKNANFARVEQITVKMNVKHSRRGDLSVELKSPFGAVSHLSVARSEDAAPEGYVDWTFMSVVHWNETGVGNWTVVVKDTNVNSHSGTFTDWRLNLFGESIDAESQPLLPMPSENDDEDEDERTTAPISTVSVAPPTRTGKPPGNPTDHIHRPVNQKPSQTSTSTSLTPSTSTPSNTADATVSSTPSTSPSSQDSFLPSPFPTFGVSKRTQIWIYGAVGLILVFCGGLATYMYLARKKARRETDRDDYEFERLTAQDENGADGRRVRRKAGDLYDAFAGESDEEPLFSDEDEAEAEDEQGYTDKDEMVSGEEANRPIGR